MESAAGKIRVRTFYVRCKLWQFLLDLFFHKLQQGCGYYLIIRRVQTLILLKFYRELL